MEFVLIGVAVVLGMGYAIIIFQCMKAWNALPYWEIPTDWSPQTFASILVPARNEEENLSTCLQTLLDQKYPSNLFEIIVIDDHSDDDTVAVAKRLNAENLTVLSLKGKTHKKAAIELGIEKAKGDLIITTDADCLANENWLALITSFYESKKAKFIAAPVNFHEEQNTFERFQSLDFIGMMGVTGAGIQTQKLSLCNGANLAYEKQAFYEVDGFKNIDGIASGDDILLLEKFQKAFPERVFFLKNKAATILTKAKPTLKEFINQRLRWAAKTGFYKNRTTVFIQNWVGAFSLFIVAMFFLIPFRGMLPLRLFVYSLVFKSIIDFFYLRKMTIFFERKDLMREFISAQVWHLFYIVLVGGGSFFYKETEWKGRKV